MAKKKMTMKEFERSSYDKEPKGVKEGSKEDMALDKKQLKAVNKGMKKGGKVCGKAAGGIMRGTGAAVKGRRFSYDG